jgi:hypothetical protein
MYTTKGWNNMIISIERQTWYGIGLAHIFDGKHSTALCSFPINTKAELKELKATYPKVKVTYQR